MARTAGPLQVPQRAGGEPPASACRDNGQRTRAEDAAASEPAIAAGGAAAGHAQGLCDERGTQWPAHPYEDTAPASGQDSSNAHFGAEALRWLDAVVREVSALPGARQVRLMPVESFSMHARNLSLHAETVSLPWAAQLRSSAAKVFHPLKDADIP